MLLVGSLLKADMGPSWAENAVFRFGDDFNDLFLWRQTAVGLPVEWRPGIRRFNNFRS